MKNTMNFSFLLVSGVVVVLGLSISFQGILADWADPTGAPPSNNMSAPLDQSSTNQAKLGGLALGGSLAVNGNSSVGNSLSVDGNIGIGTLSPSHQLHIYNTAANPEIDIQGVEGAGNYWALYNERGDNSLRIWQGENRLIITANGNIGIGKTDPGQRLDVNGNVQATAFYYSSDQRLKTDIQPLSGSLEKIKQLEGRSFNWIAGGGEGIGLIAQEVEKIYPELVTTNPKTDLKSVEYGNLVAPLIEAVKEQQKEIEHLKAKINELQAK